MKRFVFRLETVLRVRAAAEEREIVELARRINCTREEEAQLGRLADLYEASQEEAGEDWWDRLQWFCYREQLRQEIRRVAQALEQAQRAEAEQRESVLTARRERLTVEKLKERRYAAFRAEERLRENRQLDEVACLSFNHRWLEERR
ncbi:flagellar export protein FliJ [Desulfothermobacter acidiphilus]|uniref:flagellar export protein FliJ n=1 Tax=Desulfothermobacter acidiphilus TaxID=1938353 RepID=UPI003F8C65F4